MKEKIICRVLTGPTASGKSALGLELAEKHGWDILCMDSMQIYRRMDIGTAKPTPADRNRVRHEMLDICEPDESFSVAMYQEMAARLIREKGKNGRPVLLVGGTGLYLQAMMHPMGLGQIPANEALREELRQLAATPEGKKTLHDRLTALDPDTAARLPENDVRRIIRAIEVTLGTGIPFSAQPRVERKTEFEWCVVALHLPRDVLYHRINRRVEEMVRQGLPEEVRALLAEGLSPESQSMQGLGYKEMIPFLRGDWSLEKAVEEIQKGSRHYAKRQETFLKREPCLKWLDPLAADALSQAEALLAAG